MTRRICVRCKRSFPMREMEKLGKSGYLCSDTLECMKLRAGISDTHASLHSLQESEETRT